LPIGAESQSAFLGIARRTEKKIREIKFKINDAANSYRVTYWRKVHRCVNILAQ
jgi:phage-related protein